MKKIITLFLTLFMCISALTSSQVYATEQGVSGVIVDYLPGSYCCTMLPLEAVLQGLGVTNSKNSTEWYGLYFKVEIPDLCRTDFYNIYGGNERWIGSANTLCYNGVYYAEMEGMCYGLGIAYSIDQASGLVHLSFNGKDMYIKCYHLINRVGKYPENYSIGTISKMPVMVSREDGSTAYYYFYDIDEFYRLGDDVVAVGVDAIAAGYEQEIKTNNIIGIMEARYTKKENGKYKNINMYVDDRIIDGEKVYSLSLYFYY